MGGDGDILDVPAERLAGTWVIGREFHDGKTLYWAGSHELSPSYWAADIALAGHYETRTAAKRAYEQLNVGRPHIDFVYIDRGTIA